MSVNLLTLQCNLNITVTHRTAQRGLDREVTVLVVSRFEFTWIDLALTSPLADQPVASESERSRDQWQCAAVTLHVNLSFSFVSRVSKHLIEFITIES